MLQNDSADEYDLEAARVAVTSNYLMDQLEPPVQYATNHRSPQMLIMNKPDAHNNLDFVPNSSLQYSTFIGKIYTYYI